MIADLMMTTPAADPQISGAWILSLITTVGGVISLVWGKKQHDKAKAAETSVTIKDQPVGVVKHQPAVTWSDHANLVRRVDKIDLHVDALRRDSTEQFKVLLEAASTRENRIIDKIDDVARAIHSRIDGMTGGKKS